MGLGGVTSPSEPAEGPALPYPAAMAADRLGRDEFFARMAHLDEAGSRVSVDRLLGGGPAAQRERIEALIEPLASPAGRQGRPSGPSRRGLTRRSSSPRSPSSRASRGPGPTSAAAGSCHPRSAPGGGFRPSAVSRSSRWRRWPARATTRPGGPSPPSSTSPARPRATTSSARRTRWRLPASSSRMPSARSGRTLETQGAAAHRDGHASAAAMGDRVLLTRYGVGWVAERETQLGHRARRDARPPAPVQRSRPPRRAG